LATFTSALAIADNTLFTSMDNPATAQKPFEGNFQAGYNAQSSKSQNSRLLASTSMTWFNNDSAYSFWGQPTIPLPTTYALLKNTRQASVAVTT